MSFSRDFAVTVVWDAIPSISSVHAMNFGSSRKILKDLVSIIQPRIFFLSSSLPSPLSFLSDKTQSRWIGSVFCDWPEDGMDG